MEVLIEGVERRENARALSCGVISRYCPGLWSRDTYNFPDRRYTLISRCATRVLMRGYGRCLPPSPRPPCHPAIPASWICRNHKAWWLVLLLLLLLLLRAITPTAIDYFVVPSSLLSPLTPSCVAPCPLSPLRRVKRWYGVARALTVSNESAIMLSGGKSVTRVVDFMSSVQQSYW